MARTMTWKRSLGLAFGVAIFLIATIAGGIFVYRKLSYENVSAQVLSIDDKCLLTRTREGQTTQEFGPMSCDEAAKRRQSGDYPDFKTREVSLLRVSYRSPADGQQYEKELRAAQGTYSATPGSQIDIRAHVRDPQSILSTDGL